MEAASRLHPEMLGGSTGYCCGPVSFFPLSAINQGWRQRVGNSGERRDCGMCAYVCVCVCNVCTCPLTYVHLGVFVCVCVCVCIKHGGSKQWAGP